MVLEPSLTDACIAIAEGNGDAALELLRAGAETDKKDIDGFLAIELAPDKKVSLRESLLEKVHKTYLCSFAFSLPFKIQVASWIRAQAANEGIGI